MGLSNFVVLFPVFFGGLLFLLLVSGIVEYGLRAEKKFQESDATFREDLERLRLYNVIFIIAAILSIIVIVLAAVAIGLGGILLKLM